MWLINHYAFPPTEPGGTRHYSHARELIRRGHEVQIVACTFHHLKHQQMLIVRNGHWQRQVLNGVPFTWISACSYQSNSFSRIRNMFEFSGRLWRGEWARGLPRPDLILGSSPHPFAAFAAAGLASKYRVPFVLEIRDLWPYVLAEVGGYSPWHPFLKLVDITMRYLYGKADRIIMFSRHSVDLLARYGADPNKIVWIPNGVDLTMNPQPRPAPRNGQFTVTYLGAHNQWNSLDAVLDAAVILQGEGVKNVVINFVGDGVEKTRLRERARKESIANVRFEDPVPKNQVPRVLHQSNAFIINNRRDGISRNWTSFQKIYDYLAAGRPVIFGSCTENDPVREAAAGISVEADQPRQLAGAIKFLASQPAETLAEYGARGRRYVEEKYSIPTLVDRFEALALELAGRAKSGAAH
ncbi:MAG TPA: glycosyltransferase family 4 protein [Candidatus Angelobacter sp.]|nr:glycosyltransferase family 4 protein [Candidatus Angelobacter sp.]